MNRYCGPPSRSYDSRGLNIQKKSTEVSFCWNNWNTKLWGFKCFLLIFVLLNSFGTEQFEKFNFWDPKISLDFKHKKTRDLQTQSLSTWVITRKLIEYSFTKMLVNQQFTSTDYETFLLEEKSILWPAQTVTQPESVKEI